MPDQSSTLDQLRNSPLMRKFFHPDGTFVSVRGGDGPLDEPSGDTPAEETAPAPTIDEILSREPETPEPEPEPAPEPEETAPTIEPETTPPADGGDPEIPESVRPYVEKLRKENAERRVKTKAYDEAFEGYDDDSRTVLLDLAKNIVNAPEDAARTMLEVSRELLGDKFDDFLKDPTPKPLTQADLDAALAKREREAEQANLVKQVESEARELGYKDNSPEISELFWFAHNQTGGDLKKAHELVEGRKQQIIDAYVAEKKEKGESFVATTTAGVTTSSGEGPPKTMEDAKNGLIAMLDAQPGQ